MRRSQVLDFASESIPVTREGMAGGGSNGVVRCGHRLWRWRDVDQGSGRSRPSVRYRGVAGWLADGDLA